MKKLLLSLLASVLFASQAMAAVTANSIVTAQTPNRGIQSFVQGTDSPGTYKTVYTAGANGSKISALLMTNNDASATHLVTCQIVNGGNKYGGAALTTVVSAGFVSATPPQSLLTPAIWPGLPIDGNGNPYLTLISGDTLQCTFATALTSTDQINIISVNSDYSNEEAAPLILFAVCLSGAG